MKLQHVPTAAVRAAVVAVIAGYAIKKLSNCVIAREREGQLNLTLRISASNALNKGLRRQVELRNLTYDRSLVNVKSHECWQTKP